MNLLKKKITLGQFFTENDFWLYEHVYDFIRAAKAKIAYDPFAGNGDLLRVAKEIGFDQTLGYDIDSALSWEFNDSLLNVPRVEKSIILTNPPYLTNYSAKRKGIYNEVKKYFEVCSYDDIYQLAIKNCYSNDYGVMIIPETFINSNFPKNRAHSITIVEDDLFNDTENPICILCFDKKEKPYDKIAVYRNSVCLGNLGYYEGQRMRPHKNIHIKFNVPSGKIALRAVDTTDPKNKISFMRPEEMDYDSSDIKHSSRLITFIDVDIDDSLIDKLIRVSNKSLELFREKTKDVLLSPFKGNMKNGHRRRRLDYLTARAILESALEDVSPSHRLFSNAANQ